MIKRWAQWILRDEIKHMQESHELLQNYERTKSNVYLNSIHELIKQIEELRAELDVKKPSDNPLKDTWICDVIGNCKSCGKTPLPKNAHDGCRYCKSTEDSF